MDAIPIQPLKMTIRKKYLRHVRYFVALGYVHLRHPFKSGKLFRTCNLLLILYIVELYKVL